MKKATLSSAAVDDKNYYFHLLNEHFCLFCLTIHSAFAVLYLTLSVPSLTIASALSIGVYYIALKLNIAGRLGWAWLLVNAELIVFTLMSSFVVGDTGARDMLMFLPMLFFLYPVSFKERIAYLVFIAVFYVALAGVELLRAPLHPLDSHVYEVLNIGMDATLIFGLAYFIFYTYRAVIKKEERFKSDHQALREQYDEMKALSMTDKLTGLYNRAKVEQVLSYEVERSARYNTIFSVILMDIDHFKSINDTHGHAVGDRALMDIAGILKNKARKTDIAGRWGGEEFIIICSETDAKGATIFAEKCRAAIQSYDFQMVGHVTASFGVGQYMRGLDSAKLVEAVDKALYQSKAEGRNRVTICKDYPAALKVVTT